jgi:UPF0716 protein FxsA
MFARLLLLFITIPLIELILFLTIGEWIGLPATIGVVILTGFLGAWLTKAQGLRTLRRYRETLAGGRLPHDELLEGLLILVAGAVLLTPGFLTDAAGFLLLVPPLRARVVAWLKDSLKVRLRFMVQDAGGMKNTPGKTPGEILEAEVIDD